MLSARVFGSVARGEATPSSDLDLLIAPGPNLSTRFPAGLILDLERLVGHTLQDAVLRNLQIMKNVV